MSNMSGVDRAETTRTSFALWKDLDTASQPRLLTCSPSLANLVVTKAKELIALIWPLQPSSASPATVVAVPSPSGRPHPAPRPGSRRSDSGHSEADLEVPEKKMMWEISQTPDFVALSIRGHGGNGHLFCNGRGQRSCIAASCKRWG
mmetsp:Transcript_27770/g.57323  ORF Transcript_27770/g.57323 Transcript_27770/m.57323 type:complete len:147 (-) Transcript_27770:284-724(-)